MFKPMCEMKKYLMAFMIDMRHYRQEVRYDRDK